MKKFGRGTFLSIEGPEGSGKSTHTPYLVQLLQERGYEVVQTREPGGTPVGEKLRSIVLNDPVSIKTEIMLMFASRNELLREVILPAVNRGAIVIADRFVDSSYAYQGYGREALAEVEMMDKFVLDGFRPDGTLFFHIFYETMIERMKARGGASDRFEKEATDFFTRVYDGYTQQLVKHRDTMYVFDCETALEGVRNNLRKWVDMYVQ